MSFNFGSTITTAELNGIISVFCEYYEHHEVFDYSDDVIEFDTCNLEILNGIYSDEELIVETPLKIRITEERFPNQNYYLKLDYYSYLPDTDDDLPVLEHAYLPLTLNNDGVMEISFDNSVVYIMLNDWELVTKFNKPVKRRINYD